MSFLGLQAKYRRLFQDSHSWKLLRANNAPIILAFIADLFADETEIPFGRARIALDLELEKCREQGIWETESSASSYLNQWIQNGWLREMDDLLTKTDASEIALRFCQNLDQRETGTTASHLRIVQQAVSEFALAISPNINERIRFLERKKAEFQTEIDALQAGVVIELTPSQQRERIREIYQLASVLTGDFRRVEDEIREMDQTLRVQMIEQDTHRGDILLSLMEKEAWLATTDAGSAFEGFFQLLCDQNRSTEFKEQLNSLLNHPVVKHLTPRQQQFLSRLMRELSHESERVFKIRRRTEESLRAYIESEAASENRAVNRLLSQLERLAVGLKETGIDPKVDIKLSLPTGKIKITSPDAMQLRTPDEKLDTSGVEPHINTRKPSQQILDFLDRVQVKELALKIQHSLIQQGPMTIAALTRRHPVQAGLEELVAYLRVAKAVAAPALDSQEKVEVRGQQGEHLQATIPKYLLSADLFPDNIEELII